MYLVITNSAQAEEKDEKKKTLEIGGKLRIRFDSTNYQSLEDFSYTPKHREQQILERTRVHLCIEPADWFMAYIEPQWYGRQGGFDNKSQISLYQGYLEFPCLAGMPVNLKV
jgi:hypothetical protein